MLGDCPNDWQDTSLHEETLAGGGLNGNIEDQASKEEREDDWPNSAKDDRDSGSHQKLCRGRKVSLKEVRLNGGAMGSRTFLSQSNHRR